MVSSKQLLTPTYNIIQIYRMLISFFSFISTGLSHILPIKKNTLTNSCYIFISEKPTTPGIDTLCIISARIDIEEKRYLHQCCDVVLSS